MTKGGRDAAPLILGGTDMEDFLIGLIENTFAVVVAAYLLIRMERRLDDLASAIARLETAIHGMNRGGAQ